MTSHLSARPAVSSIRLYCDCFNGCKAKSAAQEHGKTQEKCRFTEQMTLCTRCWRCSFVPSKQTRLLRQSKRNKRVDCSSTLTCFTLYTYPERRDKGIYPGRMTKAAEEVYAQWTLVRSTKHLEVLCRSKGRSLSAPSNWPEVAEQCSQTCGSLTPLSATEKSHAPMGPPPYHRCRLPPQRR